MLKKTVAIVAAVCLAGLPGCGLSRKRQIESSLKELRPQQASSQQRLDGIKQRITSVQSQSNNLTSALNSNRNRALSLMRDHPGTVACIASGAVALSDGNVFSEDAKALGAKIGLVCLGIYIFSEDFRRTADNLVHELDRASDRAEALQSQIDALKPKIEAENRSWQAEKKHFDALSKQVSELESELARLTR